MAGFKAFKEPYLISGPTTISGDYSDWEARKLRYAIYWAFVENTVYRNVQSWARPMRRDHGLYRYIRNIYNPAGRLAVFYQTHLWGGLLDPEAGSGEGSPSAIPIQVGETADEERLRAAIAATWQTSNWAMNKNVLTLACACKGDVGIEVVDDPAREKVYLRIVQPDIIKDVTADDFGHVKAYTIEEERPDPLGRDLETATYREEVTRDGDAVVYRTYRDGQAFDWYQDENGDGEPRGEEWAEPYGFVPLVMIQHNNVGLDWGWAEMHPSRGKIQEVDDLASKLSDQIRKSVDVKWFFGGVTDPSTRGATTPRFQSRDTESYQSTTSAQDRPEPGREELGALYGPIGSSATPLVANLDIVAVAGYISDILGELERDLPELASDIHTASGDASGRALRVARQQAESKVLMRRVAYDRALVQAHQMAIAIGGMRGYDAFEGYNLESYEAGGLDHSISKRPVFAQDPADDLELEDLFWTAAAKAKEAGVPLQVFLRRQKISEEEIARIMAEIEQDPETQARRQQQQIAMDAVRMPDASPRPRPDNREGI